MLCSHLGTGPQTYRDAAHLCIPLIAQGEVFGVLHLQGDVAALQKDMQRFSRTAAEQFALSLAGLTLKEELHYQSTRDPLTRALQPPLLGGNLGARTRSRRT